MRFIKKQLLSWTMVLIIAVAAIAIPIAARISPTARAVAKERQDYLGQLTTGDNEDADAKHSKDKAAAGLRQDDDYYERRREYWEKRVERRLDRREEYLNEQTGDDDEDAKDSKAGKDKKDSKADKDDGDDEDDSVDHEGDEIERRREYWRKRLEKDW